MKRLIFGAGVYFEFIGNTPQTADEEELRQIAEIDFDDTYDWKGFTNKLKTF